VKSLLNIIKHFTVRGIVHITGGGFFDNIPRIMPASCRAVILEKSWDVPRVFSIIQKMGHIDRTEMLRTFNMGIGMMIIVPEKEAKEIMECLEKLGERSYPIGFIEKRDNDQPTVLFV
jgi:phosphoribosylformylglycinamidine cyclo-ligase